MRRLAALRATSLTAVLVATGIAAEAVLVTGSMPWTLAEEGRTPHPLPVLTLAVAPPPRPAFEAGVVFPQWGRSAYGPRDGNWALGLREIRRATQADWVEMTVDFRQPTLRSTRVQATSRLTPTPAAVAAGIRLAHRDGFHVFLVPLVTVATTPHWAGGIRPGDAAHARAWFRGYWRALLPYVRAAARAHVDQVSIGTELAKLERAPSALWVDLLRRVRRVYSGPLTYDRNHASADSVLSPWMRSPLLTTLGISAWYPVSTQTVGTSQAGLDAAWHHSVGRHLDRIARRLRKPIIVSEIGYRANADCLIAPYRWSSSAPRDPACQADAYWAALKDLSTDPHVRGVFVWAWSIPYFQPNNLPGAAVLRRWFTALEGPASRQASGTRPNRRSRF